MKTFDNDLTSQSMRAGHKVRRFRANDGQKRHVRTVRVQSPKRSAA